MKQRHETILRIAICIVLVLAVPVGICTVVWSRWGWTAGIGVILLFPAVFYCWMLWEAYIDSKEK